MNKEVEIAVTLNTDEANEKLEQLTAKAQALADLFTSIAEQADHAAKIMPPSSVEYSFSISRRSSWVRYLYSRTTAPRFR